MNKMAIELNFYDQGHRSYGLFSNVMQKTRNQCWCHGDRLLEMAT